MGLYLYLYNIILYKVISLFFLVNGLINFQGLRCAGPFCQEFLFNLHTLILVLALV